MNVTKKYNKNRTERNESGNGGRARCMRKYLLRVSRYPHTLMCRRPRVPCSNFPNSISQIQFSPNDVIDNVITHHELLLIKSPKHPVCEREHKKAQEENGKAK